MKSSESRQAPTHFKAKLSSMKTTNKNLELNFNIKTNPKSFEHKRLKMMNQFNLQESAFTFL
jgi:hypothetical protein